MHRYTDFLHNPVKVGDLIVYPTCSGSSSADMNLARVTDIIPVIPYHPEDPANRDGRTEYDWARDEKGQYAPTRLIAGRWDAESEKCLRDDCKSFLIKATRLRAGYASYRGDEPSDVRITNVERVVVVESA